MAVWRLCGAGTALAAYSALVARGPRVHAAARRVAGREPPAPHRTAAALAGSTAAEPLDVLVVGGGATGCGIAYATGGATVTWWCCLQREGMLNGGRWCSDVMLP